MTALSNNGIGGSGHNTTWSGWSPLYSWVNAPVGRLAANGKRPVCVAAFTPYLGGSGGARTVSAWAQRNGGGGAVNSASRTIPAAGSAALVGSRFEFSGLGFYIDDAVGQANAYLLGFNTSGGLYVGWNDYSGSTTYDGQGVWNNNAVFAGFVDYAQVPSQPLAVSASQVGVTSIQVNWSAPADNGAFSITGYLLQWSLDPTFATYNQRQVGAVGSEIVQNLSTGSRWYFRVGAINGVAAAAYTCGPYSGTASALLIAEIGNIDSWTTFGALPAGVEAVTTAGLRRAVVASIESEPNAILKESNVLTAPRTLNADTYGARRTVAGLTPGRTYRLDARAAFVGTVYADAPNVYALGVDGLGYGDPVELAVANQEYALEPYEFVATAASHEIRIRLQESVTRSTVGELERLAFWGVTLMEISSPSPYRLQSIVYESSLLNHFDLACNSVGARWWVDREGVTQFSADLGESSPLAVFTDARADGKLEYVDLGLSYDTRNVVNDLTVNQHGMTEDDMNPGDYTADDYSVNYKENTSIATWGSRAEEMEISLYDADAYAGSVDARAEEVLEEYSTPAPTITWIRWNAQEDPYLAAELEIYSRVNVERNGQVQESRVVNIKHEISPKRWMMVIQLTRK